MSEGLGVVRGHLNEKDLDFGLADIGHLVRARRDDHGSARGHLNLSRPLHTSQRGAYVIYLAHTDLEHTVI